MTGHSLLSQNTRPAVLRAPKPASAAASA